MTNTPDVKELVDQLTSEDAAVREQARGSLAAAGTAAVPAITELFGSSKQHVRWEAAKTLASIADPSAVDSLLDALNDEDSDVRWVVGEAIVALQDKAVAPLLQKLTSSQGSNDFYQGVHHVLRELTTKGSAGNLGDVLAALDHSEPQVAVPVAAAKALEAH